MALSMEGAFFVATFIETFGVLLDVFLGGCAECFVEKRRKEFM